MKRTRPIPNENKGRKPSESIQWAKRAELGDTTLVYRRRSKKLSSKLSKRLWQLKQRTGKEFAVRVTDEGIRVWRVK